MAAINIPDIYGRNYLINFDTVIVKVPLIRSNALVGLWGRPVLPVKISCGDNVYGKPV